MNGTEISLEKLRQRDTRRVAALFLAPVAILMAVYIIYPIVDTFITSTYQWTGISAAKKFIGINYWERFISESSFLVAFGNNFLCIVVSICF